MLLNIVFTIFLVLLNGFFVAAEFAIVKVRASQIEMRILSGSKIARLTKNILAHMDAYLSATQLGITLASLGLGWIGESVVADVVLEGMRLVGYAPNPEIAHQIAFPSAFAVITVLHIVFGELAPKSLAIQYSESAALIVSLPMRFFYIVFRPFVWVLNSFANFILKLIGLSPVKGHELHSAEELRFLLEQGRESGAINSSEHELIENVFYFTGRTVRQVMVSRTQIVALDLSSYSDQALERVIEEGYSRMPVYRESIDNIVGVLYAKDLLTMVKHKELIVVQDILRPAYFVPETKKITNLLREFQRQHIQMAIVLDEFGGTAGMVTIEDIMEELVGEIQDEYDEEAPIVEKISDTEYIVNAATPIVDVNEYLPHPLPEDEDYETVGGLLNVIFGKIPEVNERLEYEGYEFTILKKSKRRVHLVWLKKLPDTLSQKQEEESY